MTTFGEEFILQLESLDQFSEQAGSQSTLEVRLPKSLDLLNTGMAILTHYRNRIEQTNSLENFQREVYISL